MAKVYGGESGYLVTRERRYFFYAFVIALAFVGAAFFVLATRDQSSPIAWGLPAGFVIASLAAWRAVKMLGSVSLRYSLGRGGERQIASALAALPDSYSIVRGVVPRGRRGDIDFVVIGPTGVFAIEVKSHRGNIGFDGDQLTQNGKRFGKDFIGQAKSEAANLREYFWETCRADIFVKPVLAFSGKATLRFGSEPLRGVLAVHRSALAELIIRQPEYAYAQVPMSALLACLLKSRHG